MCLRNFLKRLFLIGDKFYSKWLLIDIFDFGNQEMGGFISTQFMIKIFILLFPLFGISQMLQDPAPMKWTKDQRLGYSDFAGKRAVSEDPHATRDTLAVVVCYIKYDLNLKGGKPVIHAYAVMDSQKSWIGIQDSDVLNHEQGHFDITEIYARRFQKRINDTSILQLHDYFIYLNSAYSQVQNDLAQEQAKYDGWTMNAPGKEYYFKWISEQLAASSDNR